MRTRACVFLLFALILSGFCIGQTFAADCQVDYSVNQWNSGFTADVTVTNNSSQSIDGWTLTWSFANGQQITGKWNADVVQSGSNVSASNPAGHWNGRLAANGGKATFGFQANHSGTNSEPVNFILNGMACNDSGDVVGDDDDDDTAGDDDDDDTAGDDDDDDTAGDDDDDDTAGDDDDDDTAGDDDDDDTAGDDDDDDTAGDDDDDSGDTVSTCQVDYAINQWSSGFTSEVKVTNFDNQDINGWTLTWTFANGQSITGRWNADVVQSGANVTASSPENHWNGTLRANGGTASFGFQGTHTGVNRVPVDFMLNGVACNDGSVPVGDDDDDDDDSGDDDDDDDDYADLDPMSGCPADPSGDVYQDRFMEMWCEIHDPANGYFSPQGVPYHSVETLIIEAPDHGHETTSEAYSYWLWLEVMYGSYTGDWRYLDAAWINMEKYIIPTHEDQPTNNYHNVNSPATYAGEWPTPQGYPSPLDNNVPVGQDPLGQELANTYNTWDVYGMHWLLDVDNTYGYGRRGDGTSAPSYINTFQRGEQESVWETVPHPSWESFDWGGRNGFLDLFIGDNNYARQWRYTNAPDADARVVQALYWAKQAADAQGGSDIVDKLVPKASKMGDYLRYSMFDKYFKEIGCESLNCPGMSGKASAHYLLSWYYAWGGATDPNAGWAFRIGSSHNHFGYQNPMAAWVLSSLEDFIPASPTAGTDWENSLQRQLEFYRWLQAPEGAIAGGATNCVNGNYSPHPAGTSTFYGMAYDDHPVYHDPGSNVWFGWQAWSMERVAELYYLTGDSLAEDILDDWVPFAMNNTELSADDFTIPGDMDWRGQPDTWNGAASFTGNPNLSVTVTTRSQDLGIVACLAKTLAYYSAGKREHAGGEHVAARTMAFALMDRMWAKYRDDKGVSSTETRGDYERMDDPVFIPSGWAGIMGTGASINSSSTFLSIRDFYLDDPMYDYVRETLDAGRDPEFNYHRFWAQTEVALANAELDRLFP